MTDRGSCNARIILIGRANQCKILPRRGSRKTIRPSALEETGARIIRNFLRIDNMTALHEATLWALLRPSARDST